MTPEIRLTRLEMHCGSKVLSMLREYYPNQDQGKMLGILAGTPLVSVDVFEDQPFDNYWEIRKGTEVTKRGLLGADE